MKSIIRRNTIKIFISSFFLLLLSSNAFALKLEEVFASVEKHYPLIQAQLAKLEAQEAKISAARGNFDASLEGTLSARDEGYYQGDNVKLKLIKPLRVLNSKVYYQFRRSYGDNPVYEGKMDTLDEGENLIGLEFSLLRNRDIDYKRLKLMNEELNFSIEELRTKELIINLKYLAARAYYQWVNNVESYRLWSEMFDVMELRNKGISRRIKQGDLANIYLVEGQTYLYKVKSSMIKSHLASLDQALILALYLRDKEGRMRVPNIDEAQSEPIKSQERLPQINVNNFIEYKLIDREIDQIKNTVRFQKSQSQIALDLKAEFSKDRGEGSKTLAENESRYYVNLSVPIERNRQVGELNAAKFKLKALEEKRKLIKDKFTLKLSQLKNKADFYLKLIDVTEKQIDFSRKLRDAENVKFTKGDSDFFLVNMREQNYFNSRIKNVQAKYEYLDNLMSLKQFYELSKSTELAKSKSQ